MAHNLFGERFADARQPAWHSLGLVLEEEVSASEAYKRIGKYHIDLVPAFAGDIDLNRNAIIRRPVKDDPEPRCFGIVGKDYQVITPDDLCSIWDEHVSQPIETIGALGYGETFFLSTYLPTLDVAGDEVENYLLVSNPMTGLASAEIRVTPVRVVCQNTLLASDRVATQKLRIIHDHMAKQRMAEWLRETYLGAEQMAVLLKDMFVAMTKRRMQQKEAADLFEAAYPLPGKPRKVASKEVFDQRVEWWEQNVQLMTRRREGAMTLFQGQGTGMSHKAAKGTLWGAYNAVVETEDYRRGRHNDQIAANAMGWSLTQDRATSKKKAFEYAVGLLPK